ncbi:hypothetical protein EDC96DRAFT_567407 [Choanephora cucurbitarum]|nr:hypothetical protein EDC96DRAFT_567407 [Choanephora cucurbitarum]
MFGAEMLMRGLTGIAVHSPHEKHSNLRSGIFIKIGVLRVIRLISDFYAGKPNLLTVMEYPFSSFWEVFGTDFGRDLVEEKKLHLYYLKSLSSGVLFKETRRLLFFCNRAINQYCYALLLLVHDNDRSVKACPRCAILESVGNIALKTRTEVMSTALHSRLGVKWKTELNVIFENGKYLSFKQWPVAVPFEVDFSLLSWRCSFTVAKANIISLAHELFFLDRLHNKNE